MVFPEARYTFFSGRDVDDVESRRESDHVCKGFAVQRGVLNAMYGAGSPELGICRPMGGRSAGGRTS